MKNIILIIAILLFCQTGVNAQENPGKLRIGLTTSIEKNVSSENMAFDQYTGYSSEFNKTNYRLGVNLEYELKENLSVNTAINYSNKDFTGTYYCHVCDFIVPPSPQDIAFRFIEVPMALKYYFLPNNVRLFGAVGLNNFFLLNEEVADNSYGIGILLGTGIEYNLTKEIALQIVVDYNNRISRLYSNSDFKVKSFALGIGIMKRL